MTTPPNNDTPETAHNPSKLTPDQVGVSEGWRLLDWDEVGDFNSRQILGIQMRSAVGWDGTGNVGCDVNSTYRTKLSRADLRTARHLPPETAPSETPITSGYSKRFEEAAPDVNPTGLLLDVLESHETLEISLAASRAECARHEHNWQTAEQELKDISAQYHAELAAAKAECERLTKERAVISENYTHYRVGSAAEEAILRNEMNQLRFLISSIGRDYDHPWSDEDAETKAHREQSLAAILSALQPQARKEGDASMNEVNMPLPRAGEVPAQDRAESDTPETDHAYAEGEGLKYETRLLVMLRKSQHMERARNALRAERDDFEGQARIARTTRRRYQELAEKKHHEDAETIAALRQQLAEAEKQRDESINAFQTTLRSVQQSRNDHNRNSIQFEIKYRAAQSEAATLRERVRELEEILMLSVDSLSCVCSGKGDICLRCLAKRVCDSTSNRA